MADSLPTPIERVAYGVTEAAEALGIGATYLRMLIDTRQIKAFRVGRRVLIRKRDLQDYADRQVEDEERQRDMESRSAVRALEGLL